MKISLLAALTASLLSSGAAIAGPVVKTPAGAVEGKAAGPVESYKGIPFAQAPVGPLRWKPPVALPAWDGVRPATSFGAACIQPISSTPSIYANPPEQMNEDCLTLNVWKPTDAKGAPVIVWIHGGALVNGYSHEAMYDGARLAAKGAIVVSINYRLGILGYFAHPGLSAESPQGVSGNYGLLDQVAALEWVKRNIGAFGGDAGNVTVAGESAGALSVLYLMASPNARGLFQKAVVQSGYMISTPELKESRHGEVAAEATGTRVATALGASDAAALRAMDPNTLTAKAGAAGYFPWGTIDGKILTRQLVDTFDRGEQAPVPVLAGFNSGEIRSLRMLAPPVPKDAATYEAVIHARYGDLAPLFLQLYPSKNLAESVIATPRDAMYGWTAERLAVKQTAIGQHGYFYVFDHGYPAATTLGLHAFHAAEIPFMFGNLDRTPPSWPKAEGAAERKFSNAMMDYWVSFARTGKPVAAGNPDWPEYSKTEGYMAFAQTPRPGTRMMPGMYPLLETAMCRRRAAGNLPWNWNAGIVSPVLPAKGAGCS